MTTKPFVGQSTVANGLLELIHTDVCRPLNTQAKDHLKENGIVSQWTPPGTPHLNGVAERRNQTLLDMVCSMMSFIELPLSFWGYALEAMARLLNIALSKAVAQTPYQIFRECGSALPTDNARRARSTVCAAHERPCFHSRRRTAGPFFVISSEKSDL
ncbi:UNVERIFIED_CONTAM: hypothetical protein Sradi_3616100 [Sesamum radiatum]|uniref:Integrase catalytic domain-containing protein n=1 Tax=Sesamum radiatum TaxID=300843 RepID=A0AAW2QHL4_SESRA